ncbi:MAG: shikimate kinase [Tissierellaceae bacterium]
MKDLENIRRTIDYCDRKLVELFETRLRAVLEVMDHKREHKLPIFQPQREAEVLDKIDSYVEERKFAGQVKSLYGEIMRISRELQSSLLFPFNIVLIGFMGSGKSSVGERLSSLLEMKVLDTDRLIVERTGMTIDQIFAEMGESEFRRLERETVLEIHGTANSIISCGGGMVLDPQNIELLKNKGKIIWLNTSPQEIYNRLLGDESRPLLSDLSLEAIRTLWEKRLPLYEAASDIEIQTDGKTLDEIAEEILSRC